MPPQPRPQPTRILPLLEQQIPDVHSESPAVGVLLVLHNLLVYRQRLVVVADVAVLDGQVQANGVAGDFVVGAAVVVGR